MLLKKFQKRKCHVVLPSYHFRIFVDYTVWLKIICDSTPPNEVDVGNNHFELSKQMWKQGQN